jgi:hypothetical protein
MVEVEKKFDWGNVAIVLHLLRYVNQFPRILIHPLGVSDSIPLSNPVSEASLFDPTCVGGEGVESPERDN